MLLKKYTKFVVFSLSILIASLLSEFLVSLLVKVGKDYKAVAIRMVVTVAIYYPLVTFLEKYIQRVSKKYAQASKGVAKSSTLGLTLGFCLALVVLFILFAKVLYDKDAVGDTLSWIKSIF